MSDLSKLDQNLVAQSTIDPKIREAMDFCNVDLPPFSLHGVFREGNHYVRIPGEISSAINPRVHTLASYCAGGRIRFATDSPRICVHIQCAPYERSAHFALTGTAGLDVYADHDGTQRYFGTCIPPMEYGGGFESLITFPGKKMRTVTINMPQYNGICNIYVGIEKGCALEAAPALIQPPVVYYGSSITQGGCASRPGASYQAILHRQLKTDYINLGFSGNAKAEEILMRYIASLDMCAFVYDYDHNAPTAQHLEATHHAGYRIIRQSHPNIPIIMMTRPKYYLSDAELERNAVVRRSYAQAVAAGDQNVYFIDGRELIAPEVREFALVDNTHPTDAGFYSMAKRLLPLLQQLVD